MPLETHFFDQYVFIDFTIPNLFNVKGKIGAYENFLQTVRARLTTQTAVVTGGGSGIGTMIASAYVQNGAKVYIASRKEGQLKEVGWPQPLHSLTSGMTGLTDVHCESGLRKAEQNRPWVLRVRRGRPKRKPTLHRRTVQVRLIVCLTPRMSSPRLGVTASSRPSRPRNKRSIFSSTTPACRGARRLISTYA